MALALGLITCKDRQRTGLGEELIHTMANAEVRCIRKTTDHAGYTELSTAS
jgi:hypothetical protein